MRTRLEVNQAAQKLRGGDQRGKVGLVYKEVHEYHEDHNFAAILPTRPCKDLFVRAES